MFFLKKKGKRRKREEFSHFQGQKEKKKDLVHCESEQGLQLFQLMSKDKSLCLGGEEWGFIGTAIVFAKSFQRPKGKLFYPFHFPLLFRIKKEKKKRRKEEGTKKEKIKKNQKKK